MGSSPNEGRNHAIGIGISGACRHGNHARRLLLLSAGEIRSPSRWRLRSAAWLQRGRSAAAGWIRTAPGTAGRRRASSVTGTGLRSSPARPGLRTAAPRPGLRASPRVGIWAATGQRGLRGATSWRLPGMVRAPPAQVPEAREAGSESRRVLWSAARPRPGERPSAGSKLSAAAAVDFWFGLALSSSKGEALIFYRISSGSGVQITSSMRGAPSASMTSRSKPSATPLASGICGSAASKSSSSG